MEKEYQFAVTRCTRCGQKLSGRRVKRVKTKDPLPTGLCPECGIAYPLEEVKPPAEPAPEPEAEPEPTPPEAEPEPEPAEVPPAEEPPAE